MDCQKVEGWLSEYIESSLPAENMGQVAEHLRTCPQCSALFGEMQSIISLCHSFPTLEIDPDFVEKVLLRTSGRPRRRSFTEFLSQSLKRPLFTPRFAVGAGLATLFLVLLANLVAPRVPVALSALSPTELFGLMDRGVQQLYGKGLKAYDKANEWQGQFTYFTGAMFNKVRYMIERIDVPKEGRKKSAEPEQRKEPSLKEKTSGLPLSSGHLEINRS
jgi:hypothetical protein